jgi:hypothetical protein
MRIGRIRRVIAVVVASFAYFIGGCEMETAHPSAATTATRAPLRASSRSAAGPDQADGGRLSKRALAQIRGDLKRAISSPNLPGIEALLLYKVVLVGDDGAEHLQRGVAARWLRQRAGSSLRVTVFERHHHAALLVALVEGWSRVAPIRRGELGFNFHLYDADGARPSRARLR